MDQGTAPVTAMWSLRSRGPAHAVSHRCLDVQRSARPRGFLGRLFGVDPLHPDAVSWYRGALGERRVGRILAGLGGDWHVLHAVPHGGGDTHIAHLVIGPPGVFTITADRASALSEAQVASRALTRATGSSIAARAIVVTADPPSSRHAASPALVVMPTGRLARHLRGLPACDSPDVVASVARAAEEWTTWRPFCVDAGHTDPDDAFARLHTEVARAGVRRALWQFAGLAAATAPVLWVASGLLL